MKLSTKSTYGLRAMLNIALEADKKAISILDISNREGISIAYLEQILNRLKRESLVKSIRGPKGGYLLAKSADKITVGDIVRTMDGEISPVHCVTTTKDQATSCKMSKGCVPKIVWMKLAEAISGCLESITLKDLCREARNVGPKRCL